MSPWQDAAACHGLTHLFYAPFDERDSQRARREALAVQVCRSCPVMNNCRDWILTTRPDQCPGGIVAGMTEGARRRHRALEARRAVQIKDVARSGEQSGEMGARPRTPFVRSEPIRAPFYGLTKP